VPDAPGTQHPLITRRFEGDPSDSLLLTDLYQLNMLQAYRDPGMTATAVFEFFVRKLPAGRGFLVAAGVGGRFCPHMLRVGCQVAAVEAHRVGCASYAGAKG
jgi:Nicotinate phosphoribosyltransferase (NAPRTase) N-terminal domain